jgi:SAM-dependent methyltransferase
MNENDSDPRWHCRVCQNDTGNKVHSVREMMLGLRDVFQYLECCSCGCLQLTDPPSDMVRYYPPDYRAFAVDDQSQLSAIRRIRRYIRKRRNQRLLKSQGWLDRLLARQSDDLQVRAFGRMNVDRKARILDVGSGSGALLYNLAELGYKNLLGVDRFIPSSIGDNTDIKVMKGELQDLRGTTWDVIMFHHSFEHMPNPAEILQLTSDLLSAAGQCLIRIPVIGWAWEHYGINWAQIDAPRHLFLHTEKSLRLLAAKARLEVHDISYDSNEFQFWVSELYSRDVDLASVGMARPRGLFSKSEMRRFRSHAHRLNQEGRGDSAVFSLRKP